jgi:Sec-independent protein secretion pathway component TatC
VVTPDNSGITMLLIATPMVGLYLGGAYFAGRWESRKAGGVEGPRRAVGVG